MLSRREPSAREVSGDSTLGAVFLPLSLAAGEAFLAFAAAGSAFLAGAFFAAGAFLALLFAGEAAGDFFAEAGGLAAAAEEGAACTPEKRAIQSALVGGRPHASCGTGKEAAILVKRSATRIDGQQAKAADPRRALHVSRPRLARCHRRPSYAEREDRWEGRRRTQPLEKWRKFLMNVNSGRPQYPIDAGIAMHMQRLEASLGLQNGLNRE